MSRRRTEDDAPEAVPLRSPEVLRALIKAHEADDTFDTLVEIRDMAKERLAAIMDERNALLAELNASLKAELAKNAAKMPPGA